MRWICFNYSENVEQASERECTRTCVCVFVPANPVSIADDHRHRKIDYVSVHHLYANYGYKSFCKMWAKRLAAGHSTYV